MARDRDDDDSRDDDRPRRRRDDDTDDDRPRRRRDDEDPPKKKGGVGVVLLIVGLAVGIPLLICGGVGVWIYFSVKKGLTDFGGTLQADIAAEGFLNTLELGDIDGAYNSTAASFKATTSKDQFEKLMKANPVLTSSHYATQKGFPTPTGTPPNRKATFTFTVSPSSFGDPDMTPPTGVGKPPVTSPKPPTPSTAPSPKTVTCTINVAEQSDGTWKVDGFTVP